jgi:hypothetical protein
MLRPLFDSAKRESNVAVAFLFRGARGNDQSMTSSPIHPAGTRGEKTGRSIRANEWAALQSVRTWFEGLSIAGE